MTQAFDALIERTPDIGAEPMRELRCDVISDPRAFLARRAEVESLCTDLCEENVFYEPWMLEPAIRRLGSGKHFYFVCLYESSGAQRLCGVFPLVRSLLHPLFPLRVFQLWRHPQCFRCTPLIRQGFARSGWEALLDWLETLPSLQRLLHLPRLPADGEVERGLRQLLESRPSLRHMVQSHETAFLHIDTDSETVLRRAMSASTLNKLRRQQRRLGESDGLVFSDCDQEPDLAAFTDQFLGLEASGWKGRQGTALSCSAEEEAFFRDVVVEAKARRRLSFLTMRLGGKLLAAQTSLLGAAGSFLFKTAYDEGYAKYSPGVLLEIEHLRRMHSPEGSLHRLLQWSDSCAAPGDGPVYRCWPERRTVRDYRIASGFGLPAFVVTLWPVLRDVYRSWHATGPEQPGQAGKQLGTRAKI